MATPFGAGRGRCRLQRITTVRRTRSDRHQFGHTARDAWRPVRLPFCSMTPGTSPAMTRHDSPGAVGCCGGSRVRALRAPICRSRARPQPVRPIRKGAPNATLERAADPAFGGSRREASSGVRTGTRSPPSGTLWALHGRPPRRTDEDIAVLPAERGKSDRRRGRTRRTAPRAVPGDAARSRRTVPPSRSAGLRTA